ncbi:MAG: putative Zn-dependent protease [Glaciecola sp.]|jgi:predicted Zn-dependent protease
MATQTPRSISFKFIIAAIIYTAFSAQLSFSASNELPELGDSTSGFVSQTQEHQLGRIWLRQLRAQAVTINDPLTISFIEELIFRLAPHSEVKDHRFEFVVIDQGELNAFAVPGGIIGINLGIFLHADDEDEVSSILAHELAHLSQRHFARQIENSERQAPVAIATLLASILLIASNNADAGFAGLVSSQAASIQNQLAYSRDWEREADRTGMKTLVSSGLDPSAMSSMFQHMLAANRYSQRPPEFLLTHPITDTRISDAANRAQAFPVKKRTRSFNFLIMQQRAKIRYLIPAADQYAYFDKALKATTHEKEKDSYRYSKAWVQFLARSYQSARDSLLSISKDNQDQPAVAILMSKVLDQLEQTDKAITYLQGAYQLRPDSYPIAIGLAELMTKNGQAKEALPDIQRWSERRGTDPIIWDQLAETANKSKELLLAYRAKSEYFFLNGQKNKAVKQLQFAVDYAEKTGTYQQQERLKQRLTQMSEAKESLSF